MSVASRMEAYRDRDFGISEVVQSLCRFQQPDGLLGKVTDDDTYPCTARGLLGLVEAYATFGYPEALSAATKVVEGFARHFPRRPTQRTCMGIRDVVRYGEVTGRESAFALARCMYDDCLELGPESPFEEAAGNFHLYIHDHRGLLALYDNTGENDLLEQAISFQRWVTQYKEWVSGGVPEWLVPRDSSEANVAGNDDPNFFRRAEPLALVRDETCTTADWMMFNLELGLLSGDDQYIAQAEHTFWNHFLHGQAKNGGWCAHRDLTSMAGEVWDFCCSHHGTANLMAAMRHGLIIQGDSLRLSLHLPVSAGFSWPHGSASARIEIDPTKSDYKIVFGEGTAGEFPVRLRRATWAKSLRVVTEMAYINDKPNGDIVITKRWQPGDQIICHYAPTIVIRADHTPPFARVAAQRGPRGHGAGIVRRKERKAAHHD